MFVQEQIKDIIISDRVTGQASNDNPVNQDLENDQKVERDEKDPYNEVVFGKRRPDSIAVDWNNKIVYVLEFKRTSYQRHTYRERGESRARAQHDVLVKSLEKVAGEAEGEKQRMGNNADDLCGRHMWISARANIQRQSQRTWGRRVQTKYYRERTRA